jgi:sugar phosphate isomerase/epimerase
MSGKISVGSSAFAIGAYEADPIPFETVLKRLSEIGYDGVEIFGAKPYGHPDLYPSKSERKDLKGKLDDLNLEVSNFGADFWGISPAASDADAAKYKDAFRRNLEFCIDIGGDSMRVDTAVGSWPPGDRGAIRDRYVKVWQECSDLAAASDVDLYWEFEPGFIINRPSDVAKLTDDIGRRNFKLMFDTCHAQMSGVQAARQDAPIEKLPSVVSFIDKMGPRIGTVHLIDSDNTLHHDETSTHSPFGDGILDFDLIIEAFKRNGYTGPWWTIDLCFCASAWDVVESSHRYVDNLLKRHGLR